MGNTQGVHQNAIEGAGSNTQSGELAIMAPQASSTSIPALKKGRSRKGVIVVRTRTEMVTTAADTNALALQSTYNSHWRELQERAVKAEVGHTRARMKEDKWKEDYWKAVDQMMELEKKTKAQEKQMGMLRQSVTFLRKKLETSQTVEKGEKNDSFPSPNVPLKKRRRSSDTTEDQSISIDNIHNQSIEGNDGSGKKLRSKCMELEKEVERLRKENNTLKDGEDCQTVPLNQYTETSKQRDKLESECRRLREILTRFGVVDDVDFEDVKPDLVLPTMNCSSPPDQTKDLENDETIRELVELIDWYKKELTKMSAECERMANGISARQMVLPPSPTPTQPPSPSLVPSSFEHPHRYPPSPSLSAPSHSLLALSLLTGTYIQQHKVHHLNGRYVATQ